MKKGIFIIPYFGNFNNYFQLFLNSCAANEDFDWLIITDDERNFDYPKNVIVKYCTFEKLRKKIQEKFDFIIALNRPYKLCDFKAAYGYIFFDEIKKYKMWGHCDTDLIFGDLSKFITDDDIDKYEKIGILGHCTLYRNTKEINELFMSLLDNKYRYKEVYTTNNNCSFDEEFNASINNIFEEYKKHIRYTEYEANIYTKSSNFKLVKMNDNHKNYSVEKLKKAFFTWDNGRLVRWVKENGQIKSKEYMYLHLQSRPMKIRVSNEKKIVKIIPNSFDDLEVNNITLTSFEKVRRKYFNMHYFKLRGKNLYKKLVAKCYKIFQEEY